LCSDDENQFTLMKSSNDGTKVEVCIRRWDVDGHNDDGIICCS